MTTEKLPVTIISLKKEILGEALNRAENPCCIILDEEDIWQEKTLEDLYYALEDDTVSFAMPLTVLQGEDVSAKEKKELQKTSKIITLSEDDIPVIPVCLHGVLFRTEELKTALEACTIENTEREILWEEVEKRILYCLLKRKPRFYFNGSNPILYRFPQEKNVRYNPYALDRRWYDEPLKEFLLPAISMETENAIRKYLQLLAIFMVHSRIYSNLNNRNKHVIKKEELPDYISLLSNVYQVLDVGLLVNPAAYPCLVSDPKDTLLDYRIRIKDFSYYPDLICNNKRVEPSIENHLFDNWKRTSVSIELIDYLDGNLEIDGSFPDIFRPGDYQLICRFGKAEYELVYNNRYSFSKAFGVTYARRKTFHVQVPIEGMQEKELMLNFFIKTKDGDQRLDYEFPSHTSRFSRDFVYSCWKFGPYYSFWNKKGIHIRKRDPIRELYKEIQFIRYLRRKRKDQYRLELLNYLVQPVLSRKQIWLFQDKIYKAGDSAEYLYKYAAPKRDGIHCYYLLDEKTADYRRLKKEGFRPLKRGSLKHRLIFLNADLVINSNSTVFAFNDYTFERSIAIRGRTHFDCACVQHGLSVQKIALAQQRLRDNTKLYFCASKYEIDNLSKPVYDYVGYPYRCLHLTGVPRYDGLVSRPEKIILFSPTWRMQAALPVSRNEGVERDYNPEFRNTDYYKIYNGLLNDPDLLNAARRYGYRIQYVLHPIISPQENDFDKNEFVEIIPATGDMSYEELFCKASLMVTDYSGVQFDFAYMRKPVIYLHHKDLPQHYEEGTFHYANMSFGEICHTTQELVRVLCRYMENDCKMPELYKRRADDFFAFSDQNNCERIYKVMLQYMNEMKKRRS